MNETDVFWEELCRRARGTDWTSPPSLEEADRRMEAAGEEPLSAAQIDTIVREATRLGPRGASDFDAGAPATPVRPRRFGRIAAMLTGSVLLSKPALLASATVGIVAAVVLWSESRYSTWTLDYRTANAVLVDPGESEARRTAAGVTVFNDVADGIEVMLEIRDGGGELGERARIALDRLREQLDAPVPWGLEQIAEWPTELSRLALDPDQHTSQRLGALERLAEQLHHGLLSLVVVRSSAGPPSLKQQVRIALMYIGDALER
jgi:hypothetical protein